MKLQELTTLPEGDVVQGNFPQKGKVIVAMRRDEGDEWKFWTGMNWLGTKARAQEVETGELDALLGKCGLDATKRTRSGEVRTLKV